jgi:predicted alpha/beta-hydrolase family hydrolase
MKSAAALVRRWVRIGFAVWAVTSSLWLADTMRTRGVDPGLLRSAHAVTVVDGGETLAFLPTSTDKAGLVFFCGSGVAAPAYAPLLRPLADGGNPVFIIKLPYRFAPLDGHKEEAIRRARRVIAQHREIPCWVIAGHSLGGALAARMAETDQRAISALVLVGTTHPKQRDLSFLQIPVTKIYATNDGIAPAERVLANKPLLPKATRWVEIAGGNHSQFGHYGRQLFDGKPSIGRDAQQAAVRSELRESLAACR